ncbi:hypothetical protein KKG48_04535, partial [Patescibacteria group bacterium]|nr:hypothetical protein [Patescibacteria group bacterium]
KSDGNVGIGTTGPLSKLGVLGNLSVGGTFGAIAAPADGAIIEGKVAIGTSAAIAANTYVWLNSGSTVIPLRYQNSSTDALVTWMENTSANRAWSFGVAGSANTREPPGSFYIRDETAGGSAHDMFTIAPATGQVYMRGKVGIGTTEPAQKLDVAGTTNIRGTLQIRNSSNAGNLNIFDAGNGTASINNISNSDLSFSTARYFIFNTGNVGIGTTNPGSYKLDVNGGIIRSLVSAGGAVALQLENSAYSPSEFYTFGIDSAGLNINTRGKSGAFYFTKTGELNINGTGNTTIAGNVGIGTTSPSAMLSVGSGEAFKVTSAGAVTATSFDGAISTSSDIDLSGDLHVTGTGPHYITNGNVGIGTTSPGSKLEVAGGTDITALRVTGTATGTNWSGRIVAGGSNNVFLMGEYNTMAWLGAHNAALNAWAPFYINPDGATKLYLGGTGDVNPATLNPIVTVDNASGNVGIGTTGPSQPLHVEGKCVTGDTLLPVIRGQKGRTEQDIRELWAVTKHSQLTNVAETPKIGETRELDSAETRELFNRGKRSYHSNIAATPEISETRGVRHTGIRGVKLAGFSTRPVPNIFSTGSKDIWNGARSARSNNINEIHGISEHSHLPNYGRTPDISKTREVFTAKFGRWNEIASGFALAMTGESALPRNDKGTFPRNDMVEYVQIKDVKPGMMVYSLNEDLGIIEPHRISALLDMGIKPVFKLTTEDGRSIRTTGNHPYLTREGWRKVKELSAGEEIAASKLMTSSMGMVLDVKGYPYSNTERQSSNEHCQGHFDSPPFLGCNRRAEINNAKHVTQRTIFTNAEKGLKNSLAIPSINIALPRSAINFATKLWYFSPIRSIA